jgi:hypothetical protein
MGERRRDRTFVIADRSYHEHLDSSSENSDG